ncbi:MAG: DUF305 domain-containing protein [Rhodothermaceae bacterium]|nr:DUF305 domain-containing protein [Rhodothermaceae bacterium]
MHRNKTAYLIAVVFVAGLVGTGCSSTEPVTEIRQPQQDMSDREALFWSNRESSRTNYTEADVDFMTKMIAHHAQALVMSALARGSAHQHSGRQQAADMPGMLSWEQLEELAASKGSDFDRSYLTFMIQHHEGAVIMVQELFSTNGAALDVEIFQLASEINAEQITEIERMKQMLETMSHK